MVRHVRKFLARTIPAAVAALLPAYATAQTTITLDNSFIKKFKDRATIEVDYRIDFAHDRPKRPKEDGDIHISGTAPQIGLPTVAELMNAKDNLPVVTAVNAAEGSTMKMVGVWRIWNEHGGGDQTQGKPVPKAKNTNPVHVFEIHPLTSVGGVDVKNAFVPIVGYEPKEAERAFVEHYEQVPCRLIPGATKTKIITSAIGFNYVEFKTNPNEPKIIERVDGATVLSSVHNLDGDLLVRQRRMVFVKGTPPFERLQAIKADTSRADECMHVMGIPRLSLALVDFRTSAAGQARGALNWNLPYEIVVVAMMSDQTSCEAGDDE